MKVLFATLHSSYPHSSLAIPLLRSACSGIEDVEILTGEYTVNEDIEKISSSIAEKAPHAAVFSCYIWNIKETLALAEKIKHLQPQSLIILGGPEVTYDARQVLEENKAIDFVVSGEGEQALRQLLIGLSTGARDDDIKNCPAISFRCGEKIVSNPPSSPVFNLDDIASPFVLGHVSLSKPLLYIETSRGCPFTCAFCLSANDERVRAYSMERIRKDLSYVMENYEGTVKFVDRTFNYNALRANDIWRFILEYNRLCRFHFEIAADLLREENLEVLKEVPEATFRFEIGVQSVAEETLGAVGRHSNMQALFTNVKRLVDETSINIHLDLVAGLPGEDYRGFLSSLDRLFVLKPHHIQVEPLKVLKGAPMEEIARREAYQWDKNPPYRIISTPWLASSDISRIEAVGRLLDLIYNSHRFERTLALTAGIAPLSGLFDILAARWCEKGRYALSMEELFSFIWEAGREFFPHSSVDIFRQALMLDRCLADYPEIKRLPEYFYFMEGFDFRLSRDVVGLLRERLGYSGKTRIRAIRARFPDLLLGRPNSGVQDLIFIYISSPGKRQEVMMLDKDISDIIYPDMKKEEVHNA